ncbi:Executioner caspase [Trichinella spiralis]|uniref:Executioner caspase n=1 Tax=Trichinella spiralis TaxID=6334 RepID=A0ABR3KDE3_TRISP
MSVAHEICNFRETVESKNGLYGLQSIKPIIPLYWTVPPPKFCLTLSLINANVYHAENERISKKGSSSVFKKGMSILHEIFNFREKLRKPKFSLWASVDRILSENNNKLIPAVPVALFSTYPSKSGKLTHVLR